MNDGKSVSHLHAWNGHHERLPVPGLVVVIGLIVGALVIDESQAVDTIEVAELISPVPVISNEQARSSTWFCAGATGDDGGGANGLVVLSNTTVAAKTAVVSVFFGERELREVVLPIEPQSSIDLRLGDLAPGSPLVSIAAEIDGGGVFVEKVVSGPTGVDRSACETEGSADWLVTSGATIPGGRFQLAIFNPFPDDAVVDVTFITEVGLREPQELNGLHIPSKSSSSSRSPTLLPPPRRSRHLSTPAAAGWSSTGSRRSMEPVIR